MENCNNINYDSAYNTYIKSEIHKINVNSRCCIGRRASENMNCGLTVEEKIGILRSIERERDSAIINIAENSGDFEETVIERDNIHEDFCRGRRGFLRCITCRRHRRRDTNGDREILIERIERNHRDEFVDPTNFYRFVNQNFCDNMTGKSNIDISNLNNNTMERRIQIEQILKKYGKNI